MGPLFGDGVLIATSNINQRERSPLALILSPAGFEPTASCKTDYLDGYLTKSREHCMSGTVIFYGLYSESRLTYDSEVPGKCRCSSSSGVRMRVGSYR